MSKWKEAAMQQREVFDAQGAFLTDEEALTVKAAYRTWEELVKAAYTANAGYRFQHEGQLFKTLQPNYTFTSIHVPNAAGTESIFTKLDESHAGTLDDPIPYDGNMALEAGKYYSQNGVVYLCTRDTVNPVYHALSDLVGLYVEVAE